MTDLVMLPGFGGSGKDHWQTLWEADNPRFKRLAPSSWDQPDLEDWIAAMDRVVSTCDGPPVVVAHSLACLLVAHWHQRSRLSLAGAFLVAVPDPKSSAYGPEGNTFANVPNMPFRFPSTILASTSDPFASIEYAEKVAANWGAAFVNVGALHHIGSASEVGVWSHGRDLFEQFMTKILAAT